MMGKEEEVEREEREEEERGEERRDAKNSTRRTPTYPNHPTVHAAKDQTELFFLFPNMRSPPLPRVILHCQLWEQRGGGGGGCE